MAETNLPVPPDSTGQKLRMRSRKRGANDVVEQAVFMHQAETWMALADAVAFAANKHHWSIFNASGSGKVVQLLDLRYIDLSIAAVTGVGIRFDIKRVTASSAGTAITCEATDTTNAALPAGVTVRTNGTITEGNLLWPATLSNDEIPLTGLNTNWLGNTILPAWGDSRAVPLTFREGQGLTVKQITSSTVGSYAWLGIFTVEDTWT